MPIRKCSNGKWGIGSEPGIYKTKADTERAVINSGSIQEMTISGYLQEMAANEIKELIDSQTYNDIKEKDSNPVFKSFVIGHEGESSGKVIKATGIFRVVKKWVKDIIQMMHDKLKIGVEAFSGHQKGTNKRKKGSGVGYIVGKTIKKIEDKLSTVGIIYIKPEYKDKTFDIASIESGVIIDNNNEVKEIKEITGIALGNSKVESPGFPGATLQGVLQEFAEKSLIQEDKGDNKMTLDEIKKEILASGYNPLDVFDREVIDKIDFVQNYRGANKRLSDDKEKWVLEKDKYRDIDTAHKTELDTRDNQIKDLKGSNLKLTSKTKLKEVCKTRNLTEQQEKYVIKKWDDYSIQDPENFDTELNKFTDTSLTNWKEDAKLFGVKTETEKDTKEGTPPKETKDDSERDERGFLKNNPAATTEI